MLAVTFGAGVGVAVAAVAGTDAAVVAGVVVCVVLLFVVLLFVLGTTLRATGRGFGSGTLFVAGSLAAKAVMANEPVSTIASAADSVRRRVGRHAVASGERVTAFLHGESWARLRVSCT
jgi:hypothetical protein